MSAVNRLQAIEARDSDPRNTISLSMDTQRPMPDHDCVAVMRSDRNHLLGLLCDLREALEIVRDEDEDCRADGIPALRTVTRLKIDHALARLEE